MSAKPINDKAVACINRAPDKGTLLSNFVINQPDMGRPINELMGMVSRIVPSSASFKLKVDFRVGILEAQLEKQNPERKKNTLRKNLCLLF